MADNVADAMTKSLPVDQFRYLRELMGVERTIEQSRQSRDSRTPDP